ncbi:DUF4372 domain-containing protein [Oligosphaera ethanolica]|uniref:DUF4372 domain-containing protein n=1 Tax=Oligosphaera ethanolica TaxID=760260 RepID=UPI003522A51A
MVQYISRGGLPDQIAREAQADIRSFACTIHVLALLYGQITRSGSLNEICDASRLHEPELNHIRARRRGGCVAGDAAGRGVRDGDGSLRMAFART